jgi:hypothetical protein
LTNHVIDRIVWTYRVDNRLKGIRRQVRTERPSVEHDWHKLVTTSKNDLILDSYPVEMYDDARFVYNVECRERFFVKIGYVSAEQNATSKVLCALGSRDHIL